MNMKTKSQVTYNWLRNEK